MMSRVESEGDQYQLFTEDTYLKRDDISINKVNGLIKPSNGNLHRKSTTCGWKLLVVRKYGSDGWVSVKSKENLYATTAVVA